MEKNFMIFGSALGWIIGEIETFADIRSIVKLQNPAQIRQYEVTTPRDGVKLATTVNPLPFPSLTIDTETLRPYCFAYYTLDDANGVLAVELFAKNHGYPLPPKILKP